MTKPLDDLTAYTRSLSSTTLARLRTGVTLAVLVLLLLLAVRIGVDQVTDPFPERVEAPICTDTPVAAGDAVTPDMVTVSVLNAGGANGLAGRTLSDLVDAGFARGQLGDAPGGTPRVRNAQIWTTDGATAAARLVRSYLRGKVRIVERSGPAAGITVVVGENFADTKKGKRQVRALDDETTCVPPVPVETP